MTDNRDALDFKNQPIGHLFRAMFFPTLIGMVSMVVLNITDGAFVGNGVGSDALAAVNIVAPLFMIVSGVGLMFGLGSSVSASIHLSRGNRHAANIHLTQGILFSTISGIITAAIVLTFQDETCMLFGCSPQLLPLAKSYLRWIAAAIPFNMFGYAGMFIVRLDGSPRTAMVINCSMAGLNILLDYLFIFPMHMGLEGAAIATATAFTLGNIPLTIYLTRHATNVHLVPLKLSRTSLRLTWRNLGYQARIGFSALLGELAIACVIILGNYVFMLLLGEDGVAAFSVACYCLPIVFMFANSIAQSTQPIVSFAYGSNNMQRLRSARRLMLTTAVAAGIMGALIICIGAPLIAATFLPPTTRAYSLCREGLPLFSPTFLLTTINVVLTGYLQGRDDAMHATLLTLTRGFITTVPVFILLPQLLGTPGLWLSLPTAEAISLLLYVLFTVIRRH